MVPLQHQQCPDCHADLPTSQNFQPPLLLEPVETRESWTTIASSSTASNIRGPGRTVGKFISMAGRGLERALATIPEILATLPEVVLHQKAEQTLEETKLRLKNQTKVLLLGSDDSGKSEVLKQMRLIHKPYTPSELESFRKLAFKHIKDGIIRILDAMDEKGFVLLENDKKNAELISIANDLRDGEPFPVELHGAFRCLWDDPGVRAIWVERKEFGIPENLSYFMSSLDRLFDPAYTPTQQDIMHIEVQTGSIVETIFKLGDSDLIIIDPGQFKADSQKWINQFSDVTAVFFMVNLSGYDERLVEDRNANKMQEAIVIWDSVCNSKWFQYTSLVLLLNKYELFKQKIKTSNIKDYFPDYGGPPYDVSMGVNYFRKRFGRLAKKAARSKEREVYIHVMRSTNTNMLQIFKAVVEGIKLSQMLKNAELL